MRLLGGKRTIVLIGCCLTTVCKSIPLTEKGKAVKVINSRQENTFVLNRYCVGNFDPVETQELNQARNDAGVMGANVIQVLFENSLVKQYHLRFWSCPEDNPEVTVMLNRSNYRN